VPTAPARAARAMAQRMVAAMERFAMLDCSANLVIWLLLAGRMVLLSLSNVYLYTTPTDMASEDDGRLQWLTGPGQSNPETNAGDLSITLAHACMQCNLVVHGQPS
jgi:hypothetical protein